MIIAESKVSVLPLHRTCAATAPIVLGGSIRLKAIQDMAEWSSMVALQRYLEVSEEEKFEAIAQL